MAELRNCSFCGKRILPGTGMLYVRKTGQTMDFCSSKCRKNLVELKRGPGRTGWTGKSRKAKK